jgi:hypothetical protein
MEIDYEVRSEIQLLLALVFVLVVILCTFKYMVPVFWQLYFSGVEVMVCGLVVDKKESECFVHLPRSVMGSGACQLLGAENESPSSPLSSQ